MEKKTQFNLAYLIFALLATRKLAELLRTGKTADKGKLGTQGKIGKIGDRPLFSWGKLGTDHYFLRHTKGKLGAGKLGTRENWGQTTIFWKPEDSP